MLSYKIRQETYLTLKSTTWLSQLTNQLKSMPSNSKLVKGCTNQSMYAQKCIIQLLESIPNPTWKVNISQS